MLARYGTSSQQTYAYSLVDHLNWLHANGRTPKSITIEDLQRYMNGVTGQTDGVYRVAWRKPDQQPLGTSAAGNVATIVKAYYLSLSRSGEASPALIEELTSAGALVGAGRSRRKVEGIRWRPRRALGDRDCCRIKWWRRCFGLGC